MHKKVDAPNEPARRTEPEPADRLLLPLSNEQAELLHIHVPRVDADPISSHPHSEVVRLEHEYSMPTEAAEHNPERNKKKNTRQVAKPTEACILTHMNFTTANELCDSDKNIMADLQHESCNAHCDHCGRCDWEPYNGPNGTRPVPMGQYDTETLCTDCAPSTWMERLDYWMRPGDRRVGMWIDQRLSR
jgi:hypothetical protein